MSNRASVSKVVGDHLDTLRIEESTKFDRFDVAVQYGVPVLAGVLVPLLGARFDGVSEFIGGLAVLAGLLFALVVFVFQLRLQAGADPRIMKGDVVLRLLDELFANVSYAVLVGLVSVAVAMVSGAFTPDSESLNSVATGLITATSLHFGLTIAMCLKRVQRTYWHFTR